MKWLVNEKGSDDAFKLLDEWGKGECDLAAPELLRVEVTNALINYSKRGLLPNEKYLEGIQCLEKLPLRYVNEDWSLIREASTLAWKLDVAVYDAIYIAAASNTCSTMITADQKLFNKAKTRTAIVLLGEE